MTVFAVTWDGTFEALPADVDDASEGASRIRTHKIAVRERLEVDHSWDGDINDGQHIKVLFRAPIAAPTIAASEGALYTKDVATKAELFYKDEDGNETQLTSQGAVAAVPVGTVMCFFQASAPTGWTQVTTHDDKVLRVVDGVGGGDAGSWTISGLTNSSTAADLAAHIHKMIADQVGGVFFGPGNAEDNLVKERTAGGDTEYRLEGSSVSATLGNTAPAGAGGGHTHTVSSSGTWRPAYIDVIIASKD